MRLEPGLGEGPPVDASAFPAVVTVGNFDGVHRGHTAILEHVKAAASALGGESVVVTFEPHPRCVLQPGHCPPMLTTVGEKASLLEGAGVDRLVVLPFDLETSRWSAAHFVERLLATVGMRRLVVGPDFALGHKRSGDIAFLRDSGGEHGFEVEVVPPLLDGGEPVSSTRVRGALERGDVVTAAALLGHLHLVDARPAGADGGGERGGLSLPVPARKVIAAPGAYAAWLAADGAWLPAIAAVPDTPGLVEVCLLGQEGTGTGPATAATPGPGSEVRCCFVARVDGEPVDRRDRALETLAAMGPPALR